MTESGKVRRRVRAAGEMPKYALRPTPAQKRYLNSGLQEPAGRLPLFDQAGQRIDPHTVRACVRAGWAKPWFANALQPDWLVCTLTEAGRRVLGRGPRRAPIQ